MCKGQLLQVYNSNKNDIIYMLKWIESFFVGQFHYQVNDLKY